MNTSQRSRLCFTLSLGQYVRIGQDLLAITIVKANASTKRMEACVSINGTAGLWCVNDTDLFLPSYSVRVREITPAKIKLAVDADLSVKIERLEKN